MGFLEQLGEAGIGRTDKEGAAGFDYLLKGIDAIGQRYEQNAMQDMQTRATQSAMRLFSDGVTFEKMDQFQSMFPQIDPMTSFKLADEVAQRFETIKMESLGPQLMQGLRDKVIDPNNPQSIAKWGEGKNLTTSQLGKAVTVLSQFKDVNPNFWEEKTDSMGRQLWINKATGEPKFPPNPKEEEKVWVHRVTPDDRVIEQEVPKSQLPGAEAAGWAIGKSTAKPRPRENEPDKPDLVEYFFPDGRTAKAREGSADAKQYISEGASKIKPSVAAGRELAAIEKDYAATLRELNRVESGSVDLIDPGRKQAVADRINEKLSNLRVEYESRNGDVGKLGLKEEPKANPAPAAITDMLKSSRGAAVPASAPDPKTRAQAQAMADLAIKNNKTPNYAKLPPEIAEQVKAILSGRGR